MTDMKIKAVRARAVNVPLQYPVRTSVGVVATSPLVLIDLETDTGVVGRSYVFTYTPLALDATRTLVASFGDAIAGRPVAPFDVDAFFAARLRVVGRTGLAMMACAGLDMALWDALAVHRGVPLAVLLGGVPKQIPAYDSHSMDGEELGVERARRSVAEGYRAIKTKIGYPTLGEDLRIVRALRRCIGPDTELMVDYNQGLSVPEAARRIRALAGEGVSWVEEPTVQEDLQGHARLRAAGVPIQMGENWCGPEQMQAALQAGACDLAMPDAMKIGGVTGWMRAAALGQAAGIPMSSHIFQEVSVHLLSVTPTAHWLERMDLAGPVLSGGVRFQNGLAICPDTPGTGIRWDEEAVARFAA
ncbi:enolase C-terminal domain-like protein [Xenophilus azovorans]|uniref:enolase C-terminal domain-like protein n=1 Tax=Xenophilus azovorans TaxID=151755 RepID=UPI000570AF72|nr:enolase C-terminal domain-like protein [Xenophilus azovorans]